MFLKYFSLKLWSVRQNKPIIQRNVSSSDDFKKCKRCFKTSQYNSDTYYRVEGKVKIHTQRNCAAIQHCDVVKTSMKEDDEICKICVKHEQDHQKDNKKKRKRNNDDINEK